MTSRERVERSIEGKLIGRVPRDLWKLPWAEIHHPGMIDRITREFPNDIVSPPPGYAEKPKTNGNHYSVGTYVDEWGSVFENIQAGVIGEVKEPVVESYDSIDALRTPVELLSIDREGIDAFCTDSDKFVMMDGCARPFERLQFLRTTEKLYIDLAEESIASSETVAGAEVGVTQLIRRIHGFFCEQLEEWAKTKVDALMFMDDWGSQQSLLINPIQWRRVFKPLYRDYIEIAHRAGKRAFMHSDGYIIDIIPDLIELGLDALNSQLFCMGLDKLEAFKGDLCFWGEIDRQHLLPDATQAEIVEAVELVRESLFSSGGVIAQCEFGPGAKPDNVYEVFSSWDRIVL